MRFRPECYFIKIQQFLLQADIFQNQLLRRNPGDKCLHNSWSWLINEANPSLTTFTKVKPVFQLLQDQWMVPPVSFRIVVGDMVNWISIKAVTDGRIGCVKSNFETVSYDRTIVVMHRI